MKKYLTATIQSAGCSFPTRLWWFGVCLWPLLMGSCIEKIAFEAPGTAEEQVVIYGKITNHPGPHQLTISKTITDVLAKPTPIPDAQAYLRDSDGHVWTYEHVEREKYQLPAGTITGEVGKSYTIEVQLPDGTTYLSEPETMQPVPPINSVYYDFAEESFLSPTGVAISDWFIRIYIDAPVPAEDEGPFLRWEMNNVYQLTELTVNVVDSPRVCYLTEIMDGQEIRMFNAEQTPLTRLQGQLTGKKKLGDTFFEKQFYNVFQHSMTRRAARYYEQLQLVSNPSGNIFDAPPAAVKGNIYRAGNELVPALGYFEANAVDTARTFTENEDLPIFIQPRCVYFLDELDSPCYNCLLFSGATLEPPSYWCF